MSSPRVRSQRVQCVTESEYESADVLTNTNSMASVTPELSPFLAMTRAFDTRARNDKIERYERKLKRLVKHADFNTIAKVYEKHPNKLLHTRAGWLSYRKRDKKKYLKYLKKEYFLLKKALCPDGIEQ